MLLITHEMDVVKRICDKVAVMDKGVLIEQGTVGEIFANPQTPLAKSFIHSTFHIGLPNSYLSQLKSEPALGLSPVICFEFTGNSVDMPLFSLASKQFDVDFNILTSQMDYAGDIKFGFTIAELIGEGTSVMQAIEFLTAHRVNIEIIGYVE